MTKTAEELTEDWKAGKLEADNDYYIEIAGGVVIIDYYTQQEDNSHYPLGLGFDLSADKYIKKILAPVPTYDEYKAMQEELTEFKRSVTSYIGKPIDYDIACETVNKLLDDKKKLKKELAEHRENCCCLENEKLRLDKAKFEEENNKLRDLLKDIKLFFEECNPHDFTVVADNMEVYLTHINEVLK